MAPLCLVWACGRCYCADRVLCPSSPEGQPAESEWGVIYESDASLLCGHWLCGGTLDFPANTSGGPRHAVSVARPSVGRVFVGLGARTRCASILSARAHCFCPEVRLAAFILLSFLSILIFWRFGSRLHLPGCQGESRRASLDGQPRAEVPK
jgi:hypothetical protein